MKKLLIALIVVVLFALGGLTVQAAEYTYADHFTVKLEGQVVDVRAVLYEGRTMLPLRQLGEMVGCTINWNSGDQTVTVIIPHLSIPGVVMTLNSTNVTLYFESGETGEVTSSQSTIDAPPILVNDVTYAPLRFVAEQIGYEVSFADNVVELNSPSGNQVIISNDDPQSSLFSIAMHVQEYVESNIVEIPEFVGSSIEIDKLNAAINEDIVEPFHVFMSEKQDHQWVEIKTYPFSSADYLQVVITYTILPNYGDNTKIFSYVYDIELDSYVTVSESLGYNGFDSEEMIAYIIRHTEDLNIGLSPVNVELAALRYFGGLVEFLTSVEFINPEDGTSYFEYYSYIPGSDYELNQLDSRILFDPYDMDEMVPALSYMHNQ